MPWRPSSGQHGNYIFAKAVNSVWQPVYIGQGDLQARYNAALREGCVTSKGATHYHEHLNSNIVRVMISYCIQRATRHRVPLNKVRRRGWANGRF